MRVLLLAASLIAVRALPPRLHTPANAAETALADTKVDGDRVLPALQRLDADLEESERRHLRPKTRELERTERFRAGAQKVIDGSCKDMITEGMTRAHAFHACSGTMRVSNTLKKPKPCYFLVKDFSEGTGWRHRCSSNPSKQMRNGWLFWERNLRLDEEAVEADLAKLKDMKDRGYLTDTQYEEQKEPILARLRRGAPRD